MARPDRTLTTDAAALDPNADNEATVAGLDALDTPQNGPVRTGRGRLLRFAGRALPPIVAIVALVVLWQVLWAAAIWPEYQLPSPKAVWAQIAERIPTGEIAGYMWVSVHR
ncbi:MAG TPA: hypothetical protein VFT95_08550, partial [Micromonosporaceae bacterium]|nr:hypothetical protein [Micromonosporaceae bacterium]